MPTRTVYFSEENLLRAVSKGSVSGYVNELIDADRDGVPPKSTPKTEKVVGIKDTAYKELLNNLPAGVSVGLTPKSNPKEPGFCVNGHYAGGMTKCPVCGEKVRK